MKKLWLSLLAMTFGLSASFAAYSPSMSEQKAVDAAGTAIVQIIETKHGGDFDLLLNILLSFESKVVWDERKMWILEHLIQIAQNNMWPVILPTMDLAPLENVVWSQVIRWVSFDGSEIWRANSTTSEDGTRVYAEFEGLSDAGSDNFYEGWIVRQSWWLSVLSTGELTENNGIMINDRSTSDDISDHTFYVLTLEPRDNDPAPADHILEAHVK